MLIIDVKSELQATPKRTPAIPVRNVSTSSVLLITHENTHEDTSNLPVSTYTPDSEALKNLYAELRAIKADREILSGSIAGKALAYEKGELDVSELEKLYEEIDRYTVEGAEVYKTIEHYQRYGELPQQPDTPRPAKESDNIYELKERKRSLVNMRNKLRKKLELAHSGARKPQNPVKISEWEMALIEYDREWEEIRVKINDLDYE